ncbi:MAG: hypothetical protein MJ195_01275 [Mycoplasmoidaceae bacterium]|nr:hypothetical protein [Mycoplasmoidaceae bacterium]
MERLRTKKETKYYEKLAKRVFARKTKYFRRNVHLNRKETYLKIIRIKNDDQFYHEIEGFKAIPSDICFYINHVSELTDKNKYYSVKDSDYIITDSRTNKVIAINDKPKKYPDFFNV